MVLRKNVKWCCVVVQGGGSGGVVLEDVIIMLKVSIVEVKRVVVLRKRLECAENEY